ncbi:MAG: HEPN domain-containing protein [Lysobacteraceae bacterium]|nr:MAG: HEPN domain-containing protein [Xanthomonadaceae bacterium]
MSAEPSDVQSWLAKAHSDLLSAQILIANDPAILDTACFHCQQAAEKAIYSFVLALLPDNVIPPSLQPS